jgi:hypothetical protein
MRLRYIRMTTNGIILICNPNNQYHVKGGARVIKELRHDSFHS